MKRGLLIASLLFVCAVQFAKAQVPEESIDCGTDKIVPFADCVSPDGHYAVGWTLRPKAPSTKPVDWSLWKSDQPWDFLDRYNFDDDDSKSTYVVLNLIVDLQTKHFLDLPCKDPYFPRENHRYLSVHWSEISDPTRYALIQNDQRFGTGNLWLATMDRTGIHQIDLTERLEKAVEPIIREKMPLDYDDYETFFNMGVGDSNPPVYQKTQVAIAFMASVPKSNSDNEVAGTITVGLSNGTIVKATSDTKRDDPIADVPELAKADQLLNQVYSALSEKLDSAGRKNLKQEQLGWIQQRNQDSRQAALQVDDGDNGHEVEAARNKSLLQSTQTRIQELQKRQEEIN